MIHVQFVASCEGEGADLEVRGPSAASCEDADLEIRGPRSLSG